MWTRLIAGATAHEINNLVQGLFNIRMLSAQPGVAPQALAHLAAQHEEQLAALEGLGHELHALARLGDADAAGSYSLDLIFSDAATESDAGDARSVVVHDPPAAASVRGTADALRTAVRALLRYALAASASDGTVDLGATLAPDSVVVTVDAASAPRPEPRELAPLVRVAAGNELRASFGVVLAGAIAAQLGGELCVGPGPAGGLRFVLTLPRGD
jgi:signal transduction histidine kinase